MSVVLNPAFRAGERLRRSRQSAGVAGHAEGREPCEVDCGSEEVELGVDLCAAADTGAPSAVSASHQMTDLALNLRAGGCVVGLPHWIGLAFASASDVLLVRARPIVRPVDAVVHCANSGHDWQALPKRATCPPLTSRSQAVRPAGHTTVPSSMSIRKSSLVNLPAGATGALTLHRMFAPTFSSVSRTLPVPYAESP